MRRRPICFSGAATLALIASASLIFSGCRNAEDDLDLIKPVIKSASYGPVEVTITATPSVIHIDKAVFLTIRTKAPCHIDVSLPPIADRLTGFRTQGSFDKEPITQGDDIIRTRSFRLLPDLSEEYRLGPMPITVRDNNLDPQQETWFATAPIIFQTAPLPQQESVKQDIIGPAALFPGFRTISIWIISTLIIAGVAVTIWILIRKTRRAIRLRRMSPKERALQELSELIAKDLVGSNKIKDFYIELTMIVRRYIERAHRIRAPEQTTEEFLAAAISCARFSREVVQKLKDFLQSADLVKFAAFRPDAESVNRALSTAREYILTDEKSTETDSRDV